MLLGAALAALLAVPAADAQPHEDGHVEADRAASASATPEDRSRSLLGTIVDHQEGRGMSAEQRSTFKEKVYSFKDPNEQLYYLTEYAKLHNIPHEAGHVAGRSNEASPPLERKLEIQSQVSGDGSPPGAGRGIMGGVAAAAADPVAIQSPPAPYELRVPLSEASAPGPASSYLRGLYAAQDGEHAAALPYFKAAVEGGREDPRTLAFASLSAYHAGDMEHAAGWAGRSFAADPKGELGPVAESVYKLSSQRLAGGGDPGAPARQDGQGPAGGRGPEAFFELPSVLPPGRSGAGAAQTAAALHADAKSALEVRDYARAVAITSKALEADPDDARARFIRAAAEVRLGDYAAAREDARKGLEVAHGFVPFLLIRSLAAARQGDYQAARDDALSVLRADAANAAALRLLAFSQAGLGDRAGMLASLERAAPRDAAAAAVLSRARSLPEDADATLLFSDAFLLGEGAAPAPAAAPARGGPPKWALVALACAVAGGVAWGLIMLAGRRDEAAPRWTPPAEAAAPREDGQVGPYRLLSPLGAGGMGVVWKAQDTRLERPVALKRMRDEIAADPRERERFLQEARIVSALDHPGIVRIWGIEEGPSGAFLVFELVEGQTLSEVLNERLRLPLPEARALMAQACEAVAYAHSKGVVHRDLKPSNIMLDADGRVRVMDFGVARAAKDALTRLTAQGTIAGTPAYMAPEQEEGVSGPSSDVYALGVCFYEMLSGSLPFAGSGVALYQAKRQGRPASLGGPLDDILARALHPDPKRRFASPKELAAALDAVPA